MAQIHYDNQVLCGGRAGDDIMLLLSADGNTLYKSNMLAHNNCYLHICVSILYILLRIIICSTYKCGHHANIYPTDLLRMLPTEIYQCS